jgi:UDP-N-acetylglucosamine 2-epimerase (non-hydrolysing)
MKIVTIFGTRPEIIKLSALIPLFDDEFDQILIHTGQHYSYIMDQIFFDDLQIRNCDYTLNVGSGAHAQQTGKMMMLLEDILIEEKPDAVVVQGDTNSTLSGALTASKLNIPIVHIEAGCRSFDKKMPEEINRIVVDHISKYLFAPDQNAYNNLIREGISKDNIFLVGNTSVDACFRAMDIFKSRDLKKFIEDEDYVLLTLHRQENTSFMGLNEILKAVNKISENIKVIFPVHLRTKEVIKENKIEVNSNVIMTDPLGYKDFIGLIASSNFVLTDSGGVQEESVILNIPCLILRDTTEWMIYVDAGKNKLIGTNPQNIVDSVNDLFRNPNKIEEMKKIKIQINENTTDTIVSILENKLNK